MKYPIKFDWLPLGLLEESLGVAQLERVIEIEGKQVVIISIDGEFYQEYADVFQIMLNDLYWRNREAVQELSEAI